MTLGEKLQGLRREQGYTQEQLAELVGVSRQAVGKWESDLAYPETEKLIELGRLFRCSMDYLLKEEEREPSGAAECGFYADVKALGRRLTGPNGRRRAKKGLKLAAIVAGVILAIDLASLLICLLTVGLPT